MAEHSRKVVQNRGYTYVEIIMSMKMSKFMSTVFTQQPII